MLKQHITEALDSTTTKEEHQQMWPLRILKNHCLKPRKVSSKTHKPYAMQRITACLLLSVVWLNCIADPYQPYAGTTIVVSWPALGHFQKAENLVKQFTEETGIEVEIDYLQYLKLRDKQILEMSKRRGEYDVVAWVIMWKGEYAAKGLLTPLSQLFSNPALVDPNYDIDDIADAYLQTGGIAGGHKGYLPGKSGALYGIPFGAETSIMAYRKDIFKAQGLEVPTTYTELSQTLTALHQAGIPALTSRGKTGHQVTAAWLMHLAPLGGRVFDEQWQPVFNSPAGVKAAELLRDIVKTGPLGISTFGFGEAAAAFLSGDAALYIDTLKIAAMARDPKQSVIADKIGFALHPTGNRCGAKTGGFAMGIPANAAEKKAAFLFIQYMTSKAGDRQMVSLGGDPIRLSTLAHFEEKYPEYKVIQKQLPCADPDWRPLIPEWNEINTDVLGQALTQVITTDKPIQPILDEAAIKTRKIMQRAGYYRWLKTPEAEVKK